MGAKVLIFPANFSPKTGPLVNIKIVLNNFNEIYFYFI